jgi:hypothetical protein
MAAISLKLSPTKSVHFLKQGDSCMKSQSLALGPTLVLAGAALTLALPLAAQMTGLGSGSASRAPYTVEFKITRVQTLANGAIITHESKQVMARDSQGRTLNANTPLSASDDQPENTISVVHNPDDNTQTTWDSRTRRVRVLKMVSPGSGPGCWSSASGNTTQEIGGPVAPAASGGGIAGSSALAPPLPDNPAGAPASAARLARVRPVREDLGTDTMLGVEVRGTRTTQTIPAGQIGNDVPLVTVSESWMAPNLGITLRQITDSAQTGKSTREAVSLDLGEPDSSLFQPPEGYEVTTDEMHPVACQQAP